LYIECGANDGITQSNTLNLVKNKNWRGILIEPSKHSFDLCKENRSELNDIINCALVSYDYKEKKIKGDFDGHLMSSVLGLRRNNNYSLFEVEAKQLSEILFEKQISFVDFFSLDVEGYELDVLKGIDFNSHSFKFILVEVYNNYFDEISKLLYENGYELVENLSDFNHSNNPYWDGTHNDFLFKKI
jgi:FkbM family methyltransferase